MTDAYNAGVSEIVEEKTTQSVMERTTPMGGMQ